MLGVRANNICVKLCVIIIFIIQSTNSEWIPKLDDSVPAEKWDSLLKNFDISSSYKTCSDMDLDRRGKSFISLYRDKPVTYVLTGKGEGHVDIKFKDSNYIFDQVVNVNDEKYLIIPPYQPVEWFWLRVSGDVSICAYEGKIFILLFLLCIKFWKLYVITKK